MQERNIHSINETQEITFKYYQANQELVSVRALTHKVFELMQFITLRLRVTHSACAHVCMCYSMRKKCGDC